MSFFYVVAKLCKMKQEMFQKNVKLIFIVILIAFLLILAFKVPTLFSKNDYTEVFFAMDTFFEISIPKETLNREQIIEDAKKIVFLTDEKLNRYNQESEISKINKNGFKQSVKVSSETIDVLKKAIYYGDISKGLFDFTFEPLQNLYGFNTQDFKVPSKDELDAAKSIVNYKYVNINEKSSSVKLSKENVIINLSGLLKGYTLDKVGNFLKEKKVDNYCLNFGGNISVGGNNKKSVGIMNPRKESTLFYVDLQNSSVSTSADYQQFFEKDGRRYTHIINPMDGNASFPWQAVVAIAKNGIDADFLSTFIFIGGFENGKEMVKNYFPDAGFALIEDEFNIYEYNF